MNSNQLSRISVMTSIVLAMLVISMDTTILNTTMPIIAEELGNMNLYAWVFSTYMIASTVLTPIAGRLSDLFGRKRVLAVGMIVFLISSLLCGLSQTMLQLILFRALQGIGAGFMLPFPSIIAGDLFSVAQRGKIQAFFSAMWGLAAVLAPLLGSLFVEFISWRWIFYINLPITIISLLLLLPYKEEYTPKRASIDYLGALLFACGITLVLMPTITSTGALYYALGGTIILLSFVLYERKHASPMLPIPMMRKPAILWISITTFLGCTGLFGISSFIPLFLQEQGHSVFVSGVALLSTAIGWMVSSVPAGKWIIRYGYKPMFIIGNVMLVLCGALLLMINASSSFFTVFAILIIYGLAFGLISTTQIIGAQQLVDAHEKGISTSMQMLVRNIGNAVGISVMGALLINAGDNFYGGIHSLFVYGFVVSLLALASSLFIRERTEVTAR